MKSANGLVEYAQHYLGSPYWWGTFGQIATDNLYRAKSKQYPSYYTANDFSKQMGKRVHDCIGLIKGYLWRENDTSEPIYNPEQDTNARGMYAISKEKGLIKDLPRVNGVLVYKGKSVGAITHVGIYSTDGFVYEAKGHSYGVVKTKFNEKDWNYWSKCPFIEYKSERKNITQIAREVIQGKYGNGENRKRLLHQLGYNYIEIQNEVNKLLRGGNI